MHYGFRGRIIKVDLSEGKIDTEALPESFFRCTLGGRGIIVWNLLQSSDSPPDALSPSSKLIFAAGVLTGTRVPGSARSSVGARSPLTGGYGEAEAGGFFGARLKQAGYDAIVVEGRAPEPVWLLVSDAEIQVKSARPVWGKTTGMTHSHICDYLGHHKFASALIGPAGENMVRYACVIHDLRHAAGRCGMGAVMGSKNLKGIVVLETGGEVPVFDRKRIDGHVRWLSQNYKVLSAGLRELGTAAEVAALNAVGGLPTRNFQAGTFEHADYISGERMRETILIGRHGCFACPIRCKPVVQSEAYCVDPTYGGPEYETLASLGSNCGVADLAVVAKAHERCNALGLDTISTGATIAFAMECFERGLLSEGDTRGIPLRFGDPEVLLEAIELIATRRGIGSLLAEGVKRAAETIGSGAQELAIHVKGQEVPMHDPRLKPAVGLAYAVSPTGADHNQSVHDTGYCRAGPGAERIKALGIYRPVPLEGYTPEKVRLFAYQQWWQSMLNCVGMCNFVPYAGCESGSSPPDSYNRLCDIVSGVTGWNCTVWELMQAGKKILTLCRLYNKKATPDSADRLPSRFYEAIGGLSLNEEEVRAAIEAYYELMGWDQSSGTPKGGALCKAGVGEWGGSETDARLERRH